MPQVKAKREIKSPKPIRPREVALPEPVSTNAFELISTMLDYESAAQKSGTDLASGRFKMLTASERDFCRAELIADYIRLSIGNLGDTPGYYEAAMDNFCSKVCDMMIPSHELIGTCFAATEIVSEDERYASIPNFIESVRHTMIPVLQTCVRVIETKTRLAAAA